MMKVLVELLIAHKVWVKKEFEERIQAYGESPDSDRDARQAYKDRKKT